MALEDLEMNFSKKTKFPMSCHKDEMVTHSLEFWLRCQIIPQIMQQNTSQCVTICWRLHCEDWKAGLCEQQKKAPQNSLSNPSRVLPCYLGNLVSY